MQNEHATRRGLVRMVLWMTAGTPQAPTVGERKLLAQFLQGVIPLDQLLWLAEERIETAQAMNKLRQLAAGAMLQEA